MPEIVNTENESFIPNFAFNIFEDVKNSYKKDRTISDAHFQSLSTLFGEPFTSALELIDAGCKVVRYKAPAHRNLIKIYRGVYQHTIFEDINFCSCQEFLEFVLGNAESKYVTCRHVLAVLLVDALGKTEEEGVTDLQLEAMIGSDGVFI